MNFNVKTLIIHVRGNEDREKHIRKVMAQIGLEYELMLDGNVEDISQKVLDTYFSNYLYQVAPVTSCALKHIRAYETIVSENLPCTLILEDDICPLPAYAEAFGRVLKEIESRGLSNCIISLENSGLKFVSGSQRKENQLLYEMDRGRCTGAYLIDKKCAESILSYIKEKKCHTTIDWFHNHLLKEKVISCFWCEPPLFEQGSNNGTISSLLQSHKTTGFFRRISHGIQREFQKIRAALK